MQGASGRRHQGQIGDSIPHFALDFPRKESVCGYGHRARPGSQRFLVTKVLSSSKPGADPRLRPLDPGQDQFCHGIAVALDHHHVAVAAHTAISQKPEIGLGIRNRDSAGYSRPGTGHTPLRQRMIEDMTSRKLCARAQPRKKPRKAPEKAPKKGKETSSTEHPPA